MTAWLVLVATAGAETVSSMKTPDLIWYDAAAIDEARRRVAAGDASLQPAVDRLRREAEAALRQKTVTVTDKEVAAPSGSKHDYVSLATYWWPDESKPDGLPYVRRDGRRHPDVDDPRYSDRATLATLENTVETLGWAYLFFGDERYARHAAAMLRVFFLDEQTRMNPHLRHAQVIRGHDDGRFIGIIDTRQLARVLNVATIIRSSDAWTDADHQALTRWFEELTHWLTTHEFGLREAAHPNNHGTWYDVQVASYARFLGRDDLLRQTLLRARDRIGKQFESDGSQPEELSRTRSFDYATMNLWGFMLLAGMGEDANVDLWGHLDQRLRAGMGYLAPFADPTADWKHEQITALHRHRLAPMLRLAAEVYCEDRYDREQTMLRDAIGDDRFQLTRPARRSLTAPATR